MLLIHNDNKESVSICICILRTPQIKLVFCFHGMKNDIMCLLLQMVNLPDYFFYREALKT